MVGGEPEHVAGLQRRFKCGQPAVKRFERVGVTGDVAAVAVVHVEVDQVGEHQATVTATLQRLQGSPTQCGIAFGLDDLAGATVGKDVADLANRYDLTTGRLQPVEQRIFGRRGGEVTPVAGAPVLTGLANKGPRDDATAGPLRGSWCRTQHQHAGPARLAETRYGLES